MRPGPICQTWYFCRSKTPQLFPIDYDSGRNSVWLCQSLYNCVVKTLKKKRAENANAVWINCHSSLAKLPAWSFDSDPLCLIQPDLPRVTFHLASMLWHSNPETVQLTRNLLLPPLLLLFEQETPFRSDKLKTQPPQTFPLINNSTVSSHECKQAFRA